jgi:signal transduction histidine kinase
MSVADISARKQAEESLKDLSSRLISAQEKDRQLVSQDLHDSIGGKLTGIKYGMEKVISDISAESIPLKAPLTDILSLVHSTIEETQRITKNLHPSILDDLGLLAALREICREFNEIYSEIQIERNIDIAENEVPEFLKILIYRILQESLNNVAKHSNADSVTVCLEEIDNRIELTVSDNGEGFDLNDVLEAESRDRGLGLQSIRERTELFGGKVEINTQKGAGTKIKASWSS